MATKKRKRITFEKSSGNVFADIGFANPEREQLKAHLTLQIYRIIKSRGLTQVEAGAILGVKQPHVSALMRNRSGNFVELDSPIAALIRRNAGHSFYLPLWFSGITTRTPRWAQSRSRFASVSPH